jgi:hypothetical protein
MVKEEIYGTAFGSATVPVKHCAGQIQLGESVLEVDATATDYDEVTDETAKTGPLAALSNKGKAALGFGFFVKFRRVILDFENMEMLLYERKANQDEASKP